MSPQYQNETYEHEAIVPKIRPQEETENGYDLYYDFSDKLSDENGDL